MKKNSQSSLVLNVTKTSINTKLSWMKKVSRKNQKNSKRYFYNIILKPQKSVYTSQSTTPYSFSSSNRKMINPYSASTYPRS